MIEKITDKEAICTLILYLLGSSIVIGFGVTVENDAWISGIIGIMLFIPFALIYSRIQSIYEGRSFYEINGILFGKIFGTVVTVVYTWYSLHVGALVLRDFGEFVSITTLNETPMIVLLLSTGITVIMAVRLGVEVIGRSSTYAVPVVIFILVLMELLSLSQMEIDYLKPCFVHGIPKMAEAAFSTFTFPFGESVIFLGICYSLKEKKSPYKVYMTGLLISGIILITLTLVNILILGPVVEDFYFPSYSSFGRIRLGNFLQRMEGTISICFMLTCFVKSSICLLVACKGIAAVFSLSDYRFVTLQTGLIMTYLSFILYENTVEMENWVLTIYPYYAIPFQIIFPMIIWICAEIKSRMKSSTKTGRRTPKGNKGNIVSNTENKGE